jgi:large subunit ribosomal protein L6
MSKIGKKPISVPEGVEIKAENNRLEIKGKKGALVLDVHEQIKVHMIDNQLVVAKKSEGDKSKIASACWGLTRALVQNMIVGVTEGFEKKLELQGVGYRMSISGKKIVFALGFSHPVEVEIPEDITVKIEENNTLSISGIDKQRVGQFAADIRKLKEVEPYKGKGFRYAGEKVRRKAGKKAGTTK